MVMLAGLALFAIVAAGGLLLLAALFTRNWRMARWAVGGAMALVALLFISMFALTWTPGVWRHVSESEIVGMWELTEESLLLAQREGGYQPEPGAKHVLEFHDDSTFRFCSIDQWPMRHATGAGTWRLHNGVRGQDALQLTLTLEPDEDGSCSMNLAEEDGKLVIWEYLGDPDEFRFLRYQKAAVQTPEQTPASLQDDR